MLLPSRSRLRHVLTIFPSNAIIRVDMYTYKYNFSNEGVVSTHKNILAYILCISVVDHRDVTVDELIYVASEFAGEKDVGANSGYETYLESLSKTWKALWATEALPLPRRPNVDYPQFRGKRVPTGGEEAD